MNNAAFFTSIKASLFRGKFSQSQVDGINALLSVMNHLDERHKAYLLATAYHETAHTMQPITERGNRKYFDKYDGRLGNDEPGDGYRYRGRGYVQITGKANYRNVGSKLSVSLAKKPDLALDADVAGQILIRGCTEGWFTGKKLSDYDSFVEMRRVVNGTDRAALIAGYAEAFLEALTASAAPSDRVTTGKAAHTSTTNLAAAAPVLGAAATASRDVRDIMDNLGISPSVVLLAIALAAAFWIWKERAKKSRDHGV